MAKQLTNLSGLRVSREGLTKQSFKAHLAELQQMIRDLQEEMRVLTGGGKSQVPAKTTTTKQPFSLKSPGETSTTAKVAMQRSLRTTTKSRTSDDLVTRRELHQETALASTATGFMDLLTNQIVASGDKNFGSISFQETSYGLDPLLNYTAIDLSGATVFVLHATSPSAGGPVIESILTPVAGTGLIGAFRILVWTSTTSNLFLKHRSTTPGTGDLIETLSVTSANGQINTTGRGAFVLWYSVMDLTWYVIARTA